MLIDENATIDSFKGKKILISGGSGYLAHSVISLLRNAECLITRLDLYDRDREPLIGTAEISDISAQVALDLELRFGDRVADVVGELQPPAELCSE